MRCICIVRLTVVVGQLTKGSPLQKHCEEKAYGMLLSILFSVYHVKCDRNMSHALMCMHRNDYMSLSDSFQRVRLCRSIVKERLMVCLIFCLSFSSVNENDCDTCAVFAQ